MAIIRKSFNDMFSFSRNGEASFIVDDSIRTFESNTPREMFSEDGERFGILLERGKYNYLSNSFNPQAQSIEMIAGDYVLSGLGGSIEIQIGEESPITFTGSPLSFSLDITSEVSITPEPSVSFFQLEDGTVSTSPIRTPSIGGAWRNQEFLSAPRTTAFSRNSGTFVGQFHLPLVEDSRLFTISEGVRLAIDQETVKFIAADSEIEFITPVDGVYKFAIVYDSYRKFIRCYLNEEVGELTLPDYFVPMDISLFSEFSPIRMLISRYEYRPKALTNTEISRLFGFDYELAYDFEVTPQQVNNWASLIFGASMYGFSS